MDILKATLASIILCLLMGASLSFPANSEGSCFPCPLTQDSFDCSQGVYCEANERCCEREGDLWRCDQNSDGVSTFDYTKKWDLYEVNGIKYCRHPARQSYNENIRCSYNAAATKMKKRESLSPQKSQGKSYLRPAPKKLNTPSKKRAEPITPKSHDKS